MRQRCRATNCAASGSPSARRSALSWDRAKREEAEAVKAEVGAIGTKLEELEKAETELSARIREIMLVIPNFIDDSVPIGKDDSENVEVERFGEPVVPDFEVPYHVDIMEKAERH